MQSLNAYININVVLTARVYRTGELDYGDKPVCVWLGVEGAARQTGSGSRIRCGGCNVDAQQQQQQQSLA